MNDDLDDQATYLALVDVVEEELGAQIAIGRPIETAAGCRMVAD